MRNFLSLQTNIDLLIHMDAKTTNSKLNELFVRWKHSFLDNGEAWVQDDNVIKPLFTEDGIMRKKDFLTNEIISDVELDKMWKGSRRIVFFLKEQNQSDDPSRRWPEDIRNWPLIWKKGYRLDQFFRRIGLILYGLTWISKIWPIYPSEIEVLKKEKIIEVYREKPFALLEAKKSPGGRSSNDDKIEEHLYKSRTDIPSYSNFLKEEIDLLNPGIIVCCGNPQYNFMMTKYFPADHKWTYINKEKTLCYDATSGMIIIKINHPSDMHIKYDFEYYEMAMEPIRKLINVFPDALNIP